MRKTLLAFSAIAVLCITAAGRPDHPLEHQLVSVRVTSQTWNEYRPWQKTKPQTRTFLGTVVSKNRILMLTDDLADATLIQVEKFDRPPRVPARIVHCDQQIGLAIITVDEPGFFDDLQPVEIAETTAGESYFSATWKSGQLSLAASRWSQAKVFNSNMPYLSYLGIYFITDLTGGGWGEPVFSEDRLVGIANAQNNDRRATVLPAELIQAYLRATELPAYPGFAWLGINYQINKGLAQAAYAGQKGKPTGVRIRHCFPGSSADGRLLPEDVLLELDGHAIDSLGDYEHPRYGPVDINLIATDGHYAGEVIPAKVLRNKSEIMVDIPLKNNPPSAALIPRARLNTPPPYLVAGGFIFRELDVPYLKAWGNNWSDKIPAYLRCLYEMKSEAPTPEQQRLIVLADVFPDEYNLGYHDMAQNIVKSVNGYPVDSIKKMEEAFQHPQGEFHIIEFMPSYGTSKVILDAKDFPAATAAIMEKYQIPSRIRTR
ncbi:MAG: hypothetical protein ABFR47_00530 [Verrucomicrobiota bacterium]